MPTFQLGPHGKRPRTRWRVPFTLCPLPRSLTLDEQPEQQKRFIPLYVGGWLSDRLYGMCSR